MRPISIHGEAGQAVAAQAFKAVRWSERAHGWLGKEAAAPGEGLLLAASSIHSFGMRFAFDLVFLDRQGVILKLYPSLKPGRVAWGPLDAWLGGRGLQALELPAGSIAAVGLKLGETLKIEDRA